MSISTGRFVHPETVATHFHLREGELVADFGAGAGFFAEVMARIIGDTGRVYACEIQKILVEKLTENMRSHGVSNVNPLWCDLEAANGIKIGDGELDSAILVNTIFMFEDKETAVKEMARTVRKGGKFFVIDWTESFAGMGPAPDHVYTADMTSAMFEANGFVLETEFPAGDHHYGLAFRKV